MNISKTLKPYLRGAFFGGIVALAYCLTFSLIAKQFGLTVEDYGLWMGISSGIIVSIFLSYLKKKDIL